MVHAWDVAATLGGGLELPDHVDEALRLPGRTPERWPLSSRRV
ncbi:hypothetical protein [Streptomyces sp. SD15]